MINNLKEKLSSVDKWIRGFYIVLFLVVTVIVKFLIWFITGFQFVSVLLTNHPNKMLLEFGEHLSIYIGEVFRFLTYNTNDKPYPFSAWVSSADKKTKK